MIVFLDTEFTDASSSARLLSVGLVCGGPYQDEFYAEVSDSDRLDGASEFASNVVLPQFGNLADAACGYDQIGARLWAFFDRQISSLADARTVEVVFRCDLEWALTRLAIKEAGRSCWRRLEGRLRPRNVRHIRGFQAGSLAADQYFRAQQHAPLARHHALCDARALRVFYEAAAAGRMGGRANYSRSSSGQSLTPLGGHHGARPSVPYIATPDAP